MVTIKIKRPDGTIETVKSHLPTMTDALFERVKAATKAAGRGDCLSYNVTIDKVLTEAEKEYYAIPDVKANYCSAVAERHAKIARREAVAAWAAKYPEWAEKILGKKIRS